MTFTITGQDVVALLLRILLYLTLYGSGFHLGRRSRK